MQRAVRKFLFCAVCLKYSTYRATEEGFAKVQGRRVKISKGDPVCLDHEMLDARGTPILIEAVVAA